MTFILLGPVRGDTSIVLSQKTVTASTTDIIDSLPLGLVSIKWLLTIINPTAETIHSSEILLQCRPAGVNSVRILYNRYSNLCDIIDHDIDLVILGSNIQLKITNNESVSITVSATRI